MDIFYEKNIGNYKKPYKLLHHLDAFKFPIHLHDEIEIVFIIKGYCKIWLSGDWIYLKQNQLLLIGSRQVHYFEMIEPNTEQIILQINLNYLLRDQQLRNEIMLKFSNNGFTIEQQSTQYAEILKLLLEFDTTYASTKAFKELQLYGRAYDILDWLLQYKEKKDNSNHKKVRGNANDYLIILEQIMTYIEKKYKESLTLEDLANSINLSKWYLCHLIKDATGMTFTEYVHLYRLQQVQQQLINTQSRVTEIALDNGFKSLKTFNRVFKKYVGCSPTAYRKQRK